MLEGLLWWWLAATDERARVPVDFVGELLTGLRAVVPHVEPNPLACQGGEPLELGEASAAPRRAGLRIESCRARRLPRQQRARTTRAVGDPAAWPGLVPAGD